VLTKSKRFCKQRQLAPKNVVHPSSKPPQLVSKLQRYQSGSPAELLVRARARAHTHAHTKHKSVVTLIARKAETR
jgi:hypothetical protein